VSQYNRNGILGILALITVLFFPLVAVVAVFAIMFPKVDNSQVGSGAFAPDQASSELIMEPVVTERMKLWEFERKTARSDLRNLGFSDREISGFEDFLSSLDLSYLKKDVLRMPPQRLVDYLVSRLEDKDRNEFLLLLEEDVERLIERLRRRTVRERKSFRDALKLL
jgi:hypothetical protein